LTHQVDTRLEAVFCRGTKGVVQEDADVDVAFPMSTTFSAASEDVHRHDLQAEEGAASLERRQDAAPSRDHGLVV
jgi:hypothetical protein